METRKITVVSTRNQKKSVIMSSATTLAELKADLRQNNIDYDGMTFYEGTSKTELINDESILPHDVPYKGTTTNELVFMLTNSNKKIRSGADMTRAEAYAAIKANNLQSECLKIYGKNFTMCKTVELIALVNTSSPSMPAKEATADTVAPDASVETTPATEIVDTKAREAILRLVKILNDDCTLDSDEVNEITAILGGEVATTTTYAPTSASPYSDDEIEDMFKFTK